MYVYMSKSFKFIIFIIYLLYLVIMTDWYYKIFYKLIYIRNHRDQCLI